MKNIFGRINSAGTADILYYESGEAVTRIVQLHRVYPVGSELSCAYDHPEGIELTLQQCREWGIYLY